MHLGPLPRPRHRAALPCLPSIPRHLQDGPRPGAGLLGAWTYLGVALRAVS